MSEKKSEVVAVLCATKLDAELALSLLPKLENLGLSIHFLTCDNYYQQRAGEILGRDARPYFAVPSSAPITRWASMSRNERTPHLESAHQAILTHLGKLAPKALVVFFDRGDLEQLCIRSAERLGVRTICIQVGSLSTSRKHWPQEKTAAPSRYPASPGEAGCEHYLIWSEFFLNQLHLIGVGSQIEVVGSFRHDSFAEIPRYSSSKGPYTILVAGQAFSALAAMPASQEVALYERVIRQILSREDTSVIFRPHPETDLLSLYQEFPSLFQDRVKLDTESPLLSLLTQIDGLVTVNSTVAAESAVLGIPTARLPHLLGVVERDTFVEQDKKFFQGIVSDSFPESLTFALGSELKRWGEEILGRIDGKSSERTVQALHTATTRSLQSSLHKDPQALVLLETDGDDPIPSLRTLLRDVQSSFRVILFDRSASQQIGTRTKELIDDPRLSIEEAHGKSQAEVLNQGLEESSEPYIIRIHPGVAVQPGALKNLLEALRESSCVTSWYLARGETECFEGVMTAPEEITALQFQQLASYQMLSQFFGIAREELMGILGFPEDPHPDRRIFETILAKGPKIRIVPAPLFLNVPLYRDERSHSFEHNDQQLYSQQSHQLPVTPETFETAIGCLKQGDDQKALELLLSLERVDNTNVDVLYALALCQARLGRIPASNETLKSVLRLAPNHREAVELAAALRGKDL